jgi:hypothetical protein
MRRDRRESKFHPLWKFEVISLEQAWKIKLPTVSKTAVVSARHNPDIKDLWVFIEAVTIPLSDNDNLTILPGYATDFASIPKILRPLLPHDAMCVRRASVTHDALFNIGGPQYGFHESNDIFKRIILEDGGSKTYARLAHFGVETGVGKWHFETEKLFDIENRQFSRIVRKHGN